MINNEKNKNKSVAFFLKIRTLVRKNVSIVFFTGLVVLFAMSPILEFAYILYPETTIRYLDSMVSSLDKVVVGKNEIKNDKQSVLTCVGIGGSISQPVLSNFLIDDWEPEEGIKKNDDWYCSQGRSDKEILFLKYDKGLPFNTKAGFVFKLKIDKPIIDYKQDPKIVIVHGENRNFFLPGVDTNRTEFRSNGIELPSQKLSAPPNTKKNIQVMFQSVPYAGGKNSFQIYMKFISSDESDKEKGQIRDVHTYEEPVLDIFNDNDILPLKIGLYEGTCINISKFDTGLNNEKIQNYPYFEL